MRTKVVLSVATILMLVVGVAAIASNMGFKIAIPLMSGGPFVSNWVSIPYNSSYTNAQSIYDDIPGCTQVSKWDNTTFSYVTYFGIPAINNFAVQPGTAYLVKVSANMDWLVVGSHNPSLALILQAGGPFVSNWISVPYHTTAANAADLFNQIPGCTQISYWNNTTFSYVTYFGIPAINNFPITPGQGLLVKVSTTENWTPPHY